MGIGSPEGFDTLPPDYASGALTYTTGKSERLLLTNDAFYTSLAHYFSRVKSELVTYKSVGLSALMFLGNQPCGPSTNRITSSLRRIYSAT
jgi:hypothetical protein